MYQVNYTEKALKQLVKMDPQTRKLIKSWIEKNLVGTDNPRRHGKNLRANLKDYWRYRVADYRILADIRDEELLIIAVSIERRDKVYKD